MRTIAIINQKGGCGKTTTAINLSAVLAQKGYRTLLVDVDPQGHCALGLAVPDQQLERTIADVMRCGLDGSIAFSDITWQISQNLDLAPASMSLAGIEQELAGAPDRDRRLLQVLALVSDRYDYCIIDCPPSIGLLTFNALRAAQEVVIPVETGYFAMQGAMRQEATIRMLARRAGHRVRFMVLATMYDVRTKLAREILAELRRHFGEQLLPVVVHFNSKLREAASFGQAITEYDASCTGHEDFDQLANWLIHHPPEPLFPELAGTTDQPSEHGAVEVSGSTSNAPIHGAGEPGAGVNRHSTNTMAPLRAAPVATNGSPALSRAAELVERARALAARTAAISARFNNDPALSPPASILQPAPSATTSPSTASSPTHPTAIPTPGAAMQPAAGDEANSMTATSNPGLTPTPALSDLTTSLPPMPVRRPPQPSVDENDPASTSDSPFGGVQTSSHSTMVATSAVPLRVDALAPSTGNGGATIRATTPVQTEADTSNLANLKSKIARLYGVRVTAQGLLFVQPLELAQSLSVAGDFNHWNPNTHPLHPDTRLGIWQACIKVPPGRYRYRLVVDGKWLADTHNPHVETNPFGELNNIIEVAADA